MKTKTIPIRVEEFFDVRSGDFHALDELDSGKIPLIACGETDNGFVGYYDIPKEYLYSRAITVAYNGLPLTSKFHPYQFGTKDDVAVLVPKSPMSDLALLYFAAQFNRLTWRYSYGRKCYKAKLQRVILYAPVIIKKNGRYVDEKAIASIVTRSVKLFLPTKQKRSIRVPQLHCEIRLFQTKLSDSGQTELYA